MKSTAEWPASNIEMRYDFRKDGLGSWEEWCAAKRKELTDARSQAAS